MGGAAEAVVLGRGHAERRRGAGSHVVSVHQEWVHLGHHPRASYIERHDGWICCVSSEETGKGKVFLSKKMLTESGCFFFFSKKRR